MSVHKLKLSYEITRFPRIIMILILIKIGDAWAPAQRKSVATFQNFCAYFIPWGKINQERLEIFSVFIHYYRIELYKLESLWLKFSVLKSTETDSQLKLFSDLSSNFRDSWLAESAFFAATCTLLCPQILIRPCNFEKLQLKYLQWSGAQAL